MAALPIVNRTPLIVLLETSVLFPNASSAVRGGVAGCRRTVCYAPTTSSRGTFSGGRRGSRRRGEGDRGGDVAPSRLGMADRGRVVLVPFLRAVGDDRVAHGTVDHECGDSPNLRP